MTSPPHIGLKLLGYFGHHTPPPSVRGPHTHPIISSSPPSFIPYSTLPRSQLLIHQFHSGQTPDAGLCNPPAMVVTAGDSQRERRVFVLYKFYPPPPFHPTSNTISPALPCPSVLISKAAIKILLPLPPTHPGGLMELWGTGGIYLKS